MNNRIDRIKWFIKEYPNKTKSLQHLSQYSYEIYLKELKEYEDTRASTNTTNKATICEGNCSTKETHRTT